MKSFCIVVFCLLVLTVNATSPFMTEISSSISPNKENQIVGRHSARKLSSTMYKQQQKTQEIKVTGGGRGSEARGLGGGETEGSSEGDGLIYNVDYHGVSTHPSPSPKHPRP
ncbi:hypothetical protein ACLOJK_030738 [Asimina triloba]